MDDPVLEIENIIRGITEPYAASEIANNIDKYFTEDAHIEHPLFNQPRTNTSREGLKGIYKMLRVFSINQKIDFVAVMFSSDKLHGTIELIEHLDIRFLPFKLTVSPRFITRVDLVQSKSDNKYRIYRQQDNIPSDLGSSGFKLPFFIVPLSNAYKTIVGIASGAFGLLLLEKGWGGA